MYRCLILLIALFRCAWFCLHVPVLITAKSLTKGRLCGPHAELKAAAEQGDVKAQLSLGEMYARGEGVPQDYVEAAKWYRKAAEQGNADAQTTLGLMYSEGVGVPKDDARNGELVA